MSAVMHGVNPDVHRCLETALKRPQALAGLPPEDLDLTLRVTRRARLLGRLAVNVERAGIVDSLPRVASDQLTSARVAADARARVTRWELDRVAHALDGLSGVPIVAVKGCGYLLADTPNAAGRLFSDVDLLLPESCLPGVEAALRAAGWNSKELDPYDDLYYRRWTHELPPLTHVERGVEVDLHHAILMRTARLRPSSERLFEAARPVHGSRFSVLAPADQVLHAMVHLFYGGEMAETLRELVDIDDLLRHYAAHEPGFWDHFWARAVELDVAPAACLGLHYAHSVLGTPAPPRVLTEARAAAPARPWMALLDRLVPRGLYPMHPDVPDSSAEVARWLLYVRSHWVKMPPAMLTRHLSYKFYVRHFVRGHEGSDQA